MRTIDLRSDTVTRPTAAMRRAIADAEVGDDVLGDDPTVRELELLAAEMLGKEDAIFAASGTQSNLMALMSHCGRGDEYIVGHTAHTYCWEGGGAAVLGSIQPHPLPFQPDGSISLKDIEEAVRPIDDHHPRTRLLCLENTTGGKAVPIDYMKQATQLAVSLGLATHLDGARVFNAAIDLGVPASQIGELFDSVSVCLSKGLGAPVGSVLCGSASLVSTARRWRKVLGGGMRQVGIIAAGGLFALQHHVDRLAEDHEKAARLAEGLSDIEEIDMTSAGPFTNMVFPALRNADGHLVAAFLREKGILVLGGEKALRLVTHLDVTPEDIEGVIGAFKEHYSQGS